jgi:cysteine desulfuration protein SufE
MTAVALHPRLQEIADDFAAMPDRERLQLLLEYSQDLPELPERYAEDRDLLEPVPECQSPLFLAVEVEPDETVHLFFDAPKEAPTTRGFAAILHAGLDGLSAEEVLATPAEFTGQLGLQDLVSPLRLRGMVAMLGRIKRQIGERRAKLAAATPRHSISMITKDSVPYSEPNPSRSLLLGFPFDLAFGIGGYSFPWKAGTPS